MRPTPTRFERAPRAVGVAMALLFLFLGPGAEAGVEAVAGAEAGLAARVRAAEFVVAQRSTTLAAAVEALREVRARRARAGAAAEAASMRIEAIEAEARARETSLVERDGVVRDAGARLRGLEADLQRVVGELTALGRRPDPDPRRLARLRAYTGVLMSGVAEAEMGLADATAGRGTALREKAAIEARLAAARTQQKDVLANIAALDAAAGSSAADVLERRRRREGAVRWSKRLRQALTPVRDADRSLLADATPATTPVMEPPRTGRAPLAASLRRSETPPEGGRGPGDAFVLPIEGALIEAFTAGQAPGGLNRGVRLRAEAASVVRAPRGGLVVFASVFRHLGLLLIIDHGREYHSLLAGFSSLRVAKGDRVEAGDVVGTLAVSSSRAHDLYLELRHRGVPQNPLPWLAFRQDKVRG